MSSPDGLTIVSPVRDGGQPFAETLLSLRDLPRDERLRLVISDNRSQDGCPWKDCLRDLQHLHPEVISPETELSRVAHWDFAYRAVPSGWIKPLFVGDRLIPAAIGRLLEITRADATPRLIVGGMIHVPPHRPRHTWVPPSTPAATGPADILKRAIAEGNIFGAQLAHLYHRETIEHFRHPPGLIWAADYWLSADIAARFPVQFLDFPVGEFIWSARKHHEKLRLSFKASKEEYEVGRHIIELLQAAGEADVAPLIELLDRRNCALITRRYLEQFEHDPLDSFVLDALPARALPRLVGSKILDLIFAKLRPSGKRPR